MRNKITTSHYLFPLTPTGRGTPVFLVPAAASTPVSLLQLARALGKEHSVYSFEFAGADDEREPHATIEAMAAQYADEIRKIQTSGPYRLGGHCLGGLVAFDIAKKLEAIGEKVGLLALFESLPPGLYVEMGIGVNPGSDPSASDPDLITQTAQALEQIFEQTSRQLARLPPQLAERFGNLNRVHVDAGMAYRASPINAPIALFRTRSHKAEIFQGWRNLSRGGLSEKAVSGQTFSMLSKPNAGVLAEWMRRFLDVPD